MRDPHYATRDDALDINPEDLPAVPCPLQVINVRGDDRQIHEGKLKESVAVEFLIELVLELEGAGQGLRVEEAGVLEAEELEGEEASKRVDNGVGARVVLHVPLVTEI